MTNPGDKIRINQDKNISNICAIYVQYNNTYKLTSILLPGSFARFIIPLQHFLNISLQLCIIDVLCIGIII
jgi:hypothetical protein